MLTCETGLSDHTLYYPYLLSLQSSLTGHLSDFPHDQLQSGLGPLYLSLFLALWNEVLLFHVAAQPHLLRELFSGYHLK